MGGRASSMQWWWIDEPNLLGSANLSDADLAQLHADGFSVILCLLDLDEQPARYDRAASAGWEWHNIPIRDFAAPTVEQIEQCLRMIFNSMPTKKVVVHCRGGIGRTGTMAAAYWIAKGLSSDAAISHVRKRRQYAVENRHQETVLRDFEKARTL